MPDLENSVQAGALRLKKHLARERKKMSGLKNITHKERLKELGLFNLR